VNAEDEADLDRAAAEAQSLVRAVHLPEDLSAAVLSAYHLLGESVIVAVRSSGAGEDSADTSFAGMNATFTNVHGDAELLESVVNCWPRSTVPGSSRTGRAVP